MRLLEGWHTATCPLCGDDALLPDDPKAQAAALRVFAAEVTAAAAAIENGEREPFGLFDMPLDWQPR